MKQTDLFSETAEVGGTKLGTAPPEPVAKPSGKVADKSKRQTPPARSSDKPNERPRCFYLLNDDSDCAIHYRAGNEWMCEEWCSDYRADEHEPEFYIVGNVKKGEENKDE